jgi:hypothetical protein
MKNKNRKQMDDQSLLSICKNNTIQQFKEQQFQSTLQYTLQNSNAITMDLQNQTNSVKQQRYSPYQPYYPPVMPLSVIELKAKTANVGVPMSFFTMKDCKGSQSVTK